MQTAPRQGISLRSIILLALLVVVVIASVVFISFEYVVPVETIVLPYDFVMGSQDIGLNLDGDLLHFGNVCSLLCEVKRVMHITNHHPYTVQGWVVVTSADSSDQFVNVSYGFLVRSGMNATLPVILVANGLPTGTYAGEIRIELRRALPWVTEQQSTP